MHRALNDALHELHLVAKGPSLTTMSRDLMERRVPGVSRTTIYNAFSSQRLPMPGAVDAIVVYLADQVRNVTPEQVDAVAVHFDNLWYLAEGEARSHASAPPPAHAEATDSAATVTLSVPALAAPRKRLALEPVRLRSRLDALREGFGDLEVSEAVIAGVAEAISALPGHSAPTMTGAELPSPGAIGRGRATQATGRQTDALRK
ncbi:hypothetical protein ACFXP3_25575 [Streptomyces sp. NPDC059096]|uniref:hypothetical protein n=1 Tax=Streptomyces sp. NPDC059096 TaxID=3346727 RepID=UPI0036C4F6E2